MKAINNLSEIEAKEMLSQLIETSYTLVCWPESQEYMHKRWFKKEAILDVESIHGSSAYLIPTKRIIK